MGLVAHKEFMLSRSQKILVSIFLFGIVGISFCLREQDAALSVEETEQYIPDIHQNVLDNLSALPESSKESGHIISCKDIILKTPPVPNDPDVNLIYLNTYTWCMMQAILKTFLEAHKDSPANIEGKKEILDALSALSFFLPALLLSYYHAIPSFSAGLRDKLTQEQTEIQRNFPEIFNAQRSF
ncbi:hypothetical protein [Holospora obtusa]|uniref:hypothetical protein n=1 Tax=Holospora obtusa TaxID=49893 RepID=UPI0003AED7C6|nr:hypothetical protein [Holospora obtusa]